MAVSGFLLWANRTILLQVRENLDSDDASPNKGLP